MIGSAVVGLVTGRLLGLGIRQFYKSATWFKLHMFVLFMVGPGWVWACLIVGTQAGRFGGCSWQTCLHVTNNLAPRLTHLLHGTMFRGGGGSKSR